MTQCPGQIISYMVRIPRYITHLLQKKQCSVRGGFTVYPQKCNISAKYTMSEAEPTTHWIQDPSVSKRFPRTRSSTFYMEYQKNEPQLSHSLLGGGGDKLTYRLQSILRQRGTYSWVTECRGEVCENRNNKREQKCGVYSGIFGGI